jgi:hypothetical protein
VYGNSKRFHASTPGYGLREMKLFFIEKVQISAIEM